MTRPIPQPDTEMEKASLEAYKRGDFMTTEQYIAEIKSRGSKSKGLETGEEPTPMDEDSQGIDKR